MCFMSKIPDPKPAPPPPDPNRANAEAARVAKEQAQRGRAAGRASTMLTSLSDAEAAAPARKKTLLGS